MLVLTQNNAGFVDLDQLPGVHVILTGLMAGRIEAVSEFGQHFWLGDYASVERANAVLRKLYAAKKAHCNDFVMPPKKECNADYCDI